MSIDEINSFLDRLYWINRYLGGKEFEKDPRSQSKGVLEFLAIQFRSKFNELKDCQNQRNEIRMRQVDGASELSVLRLNTRIKKLLDGMLNVIELFGKKLQFTNHLTAEHSNYSETLTHFKTLVRNIQRSENITSSVLANLKVGPAGDSPGVLKSWMFQSYEEEVVVVEQKLVRPKPSNSLSNSKAVLTEEEAHALNRWNQNDLELDRELDQIEANIEEINNDLRTLSANMNKNETLVEYVSDEIQVLGRDLQTVNARIKLIIEKFKGASNILIDIIISFAFSIFFGLFVFLLQKYLKM